MTSQDLDMMLTKEVLEDLYISKGMTASAIAREFDVCPNSVLLRLRRNGIPLKSHSEALRSRDWKKPMEYEDVLDRDTLENAYYDREMTYEEIAKEFGLSKTSVARYMSRYGIPVRSSSERMNLAIKKGRMVPKTGCEHHTWNGGRFYNVDGYVLVHAPDHPLADSKGYVAEHRKIAYDEICEFPREWVVHHINGVKDDNRVENLAPMPDSKHVRILGVLRKKINDLEQKLDPPPATSRQKSEFTALLRERYGFEIFLELGPGKHKERSSGIGLNEKSDPVADIFWDLNRGIPLEDGSVTEIYSNQFLEHLRQDRQIFFWNETSRVLVPGGKVEHTVPHFLSPYADGDPTHRTRFTEVSFQYFCQKPDGSPFVKDFSDYGIKCNFKILKHEVRRGVDIHVVLLKPEEL